MNTMEYATEYAEDHPDGAVEIEGVHYHANELTYASSNHSDDCLAKCNGLDASDRESCGWGCRYGDLPKDDVGYYIVPPLCPDCWKRGSVSGVRTKNRHVSEQ